MEFVLIAVVVAIGWYVWSYVNPAGTTPYNPFAVKSGPGGISFSPNIPTSATQSGLSSPGGIGYSTINSGSIGQIVTNGQLYSTTDSIPAPNGGTTTIGGLMSSGFSVGDIVDYLNMNNIPGAIIS